MPYATTCTSLFACSTSDKAWYCILGDLPKSPKTTTATRVLPPDLPIPNTRSDFDLVLSPQTQSTHLYNNENEEDAKHHSGKVEEDSVKDARKIKRAREHTLSPCAVRISGAVMDLRIEEP